MDQLICFFAPNSKKAGASLRAAKSYAFLTSSASYVPGGNSKPCVRIDEHGFERDFPTTFLLRIPPGPRGAPPTRVLYGDAYAGSAEAGGNRDQNAQLGLETEAFAKWAFDKDRIQELKREADFYNNELRELQGTVVPKFYGLYVSKNKEHFAVSIFERVKAASIPLSNPMLFEEYHRQYMLAACKLHALGISHNQLSNDYHNFVNDGSLDRHVLCIPNRSATLLSVPGQSAVGTMSVRIVDFTLARGHRCGGALLNCLNKPGTADTWSTWSWLFRNDAPATFNARGDDEEEREYCSELTRLEAIVGEARTGSSAFSSVSMHMTAEIMRQSQVRAQRIDIPSHYPYPFPGNMRY